MSRTEKFGFLAILLVVAIAFFAIGVGLTASLNKVTPAVGAENESNPPFQPNEFLVATQESFRGIVAAVSPAVCTVEIIKRMPGMQWNPHEFFREDPSFEWFFGPSPGPQPQEREKEFEIPSLGSGFLVSSDGYILTNNHVVQGADEIKIILNSNDEYEAEIIGLDPGTDVAVLKIEGDEPFPYIEIGDSDAIHVGDWVMAIGNPFGYLDHSVTVGVISAKNRERITGAQYENFLQTDAAINFGNSGGPLVDIYGRAVGINTAITSQGSGIGFAVPINMAKDVYNDYIEYGEVRRAWVGITIETVTSEKAEELGLDTIEGALVMSVSEGDPAEEAGIKVDDFIIDVEGERIRSASHLSRIIAAREIEKPFNVTLIRDGEEMTIAVVPSQRSKAPIIKGGENQSDIDELGLTIRDIDDKLRADAKIPEDVKGVIVAGVEPMSSAQRKGLRPGVIITHINDRRVESVEDFVSVFEDYKNEKKVVLDVLYIQSDGSTEKDVIALMLM